MSEARRFADQAGAGQIALGAGFCVRGLSLTRKGRHLLSEVSFSAPAGAVTGLIGPNGAGKSTLLTTLPHLLPSHRAERGQVTFAGQDLAQLAPRQRARLLALVEQSPATDLRLSVRDVVALGRIPYQSLWQSEETAADRAATERALALTGLRSRAGQSYASLSGGERQRTQIARALAQEPRLMLLDEPTSSLDIRAQLLLMQLLRRWAAEGGCAVVALHDLSLAARFCDHIIVLAKGRIEAEGTPQVVLTRELLRRVYGVDASLSGDGTLRVALESPFP